VGRAHRRWRERIAATDARGRATSSAGQIPWIGEVLHFHEQEQRDGSARCAQFRRRCGDNRPAVIRSGPCRWSVLLSTASTTSAARMISGTRGISSGSARRARTIAVIARRSSAAIAARFAPTLTFARERYTRPAAQPCLDKSLVSRRDRRRRRFRRPRSGRRRNATSGRPFSGPPRAAETNLLPRNGPPDPVPDFFAVSDELATIGTGRRPAPSGAIAIVRASGRSAVIAAAQMHESGSRQGSP